MSKRPAVKTWSTPAEDELRRPVACNLCGETLFKKSFACRDGETVFFYVRCAGCALVQINPQPEPETVRARYGRYGGDYLCYETANEAAFFRLQELALHDAGFFGLERKHGPGRLLDVGCATGALIAWLEKRGWTAQGVEISGPQAEYCRARGLEVSSRPLEENGFSGDFFDAVTASHLVEHLNNPRSLVHEIFRILKRGGRLYMTTPNVDGFQARLFGGRWRSAIFDHLYLFSRATLSALLESEGFRVEHCRTWGGLAAGTAPKPVKALFDRVAKAFGAGDVMILRAVKE